ncbi:MFS transporter [Pseudonocardia sp. KRD-184]|uniref:MFS transporter n=1 Tax=Pseudonocardia oceani TaxID=2792013 RepID=A0ABS6U512_9PSEU|nr:MFS transporter [Pseudonocardia oceani]MBW0091241.1 MFS transporter [Pseudonocardia oceani]MBW0098334.1 MFS transporter [Pseudonocardia oceani]MBW0110380.1 MFS transporter [Pseudonocardia oceani]MBW0123453.1 MFS transporter [Pseudonocardia oceani]MBW0127308.1 MFS transporter [Pseudonocardia oceani]
MDGRSGWITVAVAFTSMAVCFGVAYSFGAFFAPMAAEFGTGSGATSLVFGVTACCWFVLGSVSGRAVDRFGPRPVLLVAALALGTGLLVTAAVRDLWIGYLTYGLGVGIAVACGYVPMVAIVGAWFERRRAIALAVAVSGIGIGTLAGAPLAAALIDAVGWRQTHVVFGIGGAALLLVCALVVRRPPAPTSGPSMPVGELVRTVAFRSMYAATLLSSLALFVPFVFLPATALALGSSAVAAAALVGVIGVSSVVGRLAMGTVAERFGRIATFRASFAVLGASFGIWFVGGSYPVLVAFAVVLGVGYGGWIALQPAVIAELFGLRGLGGVVGLVYTSGGIGALLGAPVAGVLVDVTGGYGWAIAFAGVCGVGSFLALIPLRGPARGDVVSAETRL